MSFPTIGIDCSPLLVRSAGVKTYVFHLLKAMQAQRPESIRPFLAPRRPDLLHEGGLRLNPLQLSELIALNALPSFFANIAAPKCDVFHAANLLVKIPQRPRLTATIHDLTSWILPETHMPAGVAAEHAFAERVLKRADGLIADSENTRQDAIRLLRISPDRIRVVHLGVPPAYSSVSPDAIARVARTLALDKPYYLCVGTIEPRKNVDILLQAWNALPSAFRAAHELLLVGMPGWRSEATMQRLHQANTEKQGIRYLGYVSEADLPALTAGATAFVYPSLYEGFGFPVAQAMAAGCPVITSNASSLPEVAGGSAVLIDPRSEAELMNAILRLGESPELRLQLTVKGIERARHFTWERTAAESLQFFSELV